MLPVLCTCLVIYVTMVVHDFYPIISDSIKLQRRPCLHYGTEDDILWEEMDESDPFADNDGVESIVDEEGELFYAGEDEVAVLDVNEQGQEYKNIFGESDVDESEFSEF